MEILLCDDDEFAMDINSAFVKKFFKQYKVPIQLHKFYQVDKKLQQFIESSRVDLAILDIDMGNKRDGITLARNIKEKHTNAFIVFITEHKEFSFEAFDVAAFGLIPKPFRENELFEHLKRAIIYYNGLHVTKEPANLIKVANNWIAKSNIISIEKDKKSVIVYTANNMYSFTSGLNTLKEQLPEYFVYANRSVIVNVKYISEVNKKSIQMLNSKIYTLSKGKFEDVYIQLQPFIAD